MMTQTKWHCGVLVVLLFLMFPQTFLSAHAVMGIRRCFPAKASSWLLIGFWSEVTVTSLFLSRPGERSSRGLMLLSQVAAPAVLTDDFRSNTQSRTSSQTVFCV